MSENLSFLGNRKMTLPITDIPMSAKKPKL